MAFADTDSAAGGTSPNRAAAPGISDVPGRWVIDWVAETGSTNADLAAFARNGAVDGSVLVADLQTAGRGRLGRTWEAPPGSSLMFSVLLRTREIPVRARSWLGAVVGLAIVEAINATPGPQAKLKWPNDILIDGRKLAGVLAEMSGDAVVVGAGINVTQDADELPVDTATSLALSGRPGVDRAGLLRSILDRLAPRLDRWSAASGDADASGVAAEYRRHLDTLGAEVTAHLPGGAAITGVAVDLSPDGALIIRDADGTRHTLAAGDVVHLRRSGTG